MPGRALSSAVIRFVTELRRQSLPITPRQTIESVRALDHLDVTDRQELYLGLRALLVTRPEEVAIFDRAFEAFWRLRTQADEVGEALAGPSLPGDAPEAGVESQGARKERLELEGWGDEEQVDEAGDPLSVPVASEMEALVTRDFSTFSAEQLDELLRVTVQIARRLARRVSRRRRPVRRRGRVDLRRTLRANLTRAEIIELRYRQRKRRKVKLVLLCDVSGSMDLYSRFLLQFLFALQHVFARVETFTFSVHLTRVTDYLRARSYREVLRRLQDVRDWSGGTKIGESLAEFNRRWSMLVDRRTIVILLSDGWDTGDPEVLSTELLRIKRRAGRVIWLNPLLGNPSYQPLTRGMAAALPLVDHFAAAHNLAALRQLADHLHF
ncbi:MAG TPA: VWA domain-containing protein [Methylomirabilota bacterium]|nr:VWA domain-containing protein [Methylomirabilota bacterium]